MLQRLRNKNLHTWLGGYSRAVGQRLLAQTPKHRHLLFAICDHYEPLWGKTTSRDVGLQRVQAWRTGYPRLAQPFRDADGRPPQHSFFFPGEEYDPRYLQLLAELCQAGFGEVELHLHHDRDNDKNLRDSIRSYLNLFHEHGHISMEGNRPRYSFIHGNWCLANARRDGRWCGVDNEVQLLFETGCYADFTFPSAPDECQPNLVNRLYWPTGDLTRRRAYETGETARVGRVYDDRLLMITGPLALTRKEGAIAPRIESSAIDHSDPPTMTRLEHWINQSITINGRPDWVFVKVHTHGAPESNAQVLLGPQGHALHQALTTRYNDGVRWTLHYVTARQMFNIAMAAMEGHEGDPNEYRDHRIARPAIAQ